MKKVLLLTTTLALGIAATGFAQSADDLNEGSQLKRDSDTNYHHFRWWGKMGRTYFVSFSLDLDEWLYTDGIETGFDAVLEYGWNPDSDKLFVRLQFTDIVSGDPNLADFDGDGISNIDEITMQPVQGDPFDASSRDGDEMADDWERFHGLSTEYGVDESAGDPDQDTLTSLVEYGLGTDPEEKDTDADGLLDQNEISGGHDPLIPDHPLVDFDVFSSLND